MLNGRQIHSGFVGVILLRSKRLITERLKNLRIFPICIPNVRAHLCQLYLIYFILTSLRILLIQQKLARVLVIQNSTFKPTLVQKCSRIKVYNALTLPILLYGSEIWALRKGD